MRIFCHIDLAKACGQGITLLFLFFWVQANAQVELERSVIGSAGGTEELGEGIVIDYTLGESVIHTVLSDDFLITQGFHQPSAKSALRFSIVKMDASCPTAMDGSARVENIQGCSGPYSVEWSTGQEGTESGNLAPGFYSVTVTSPSCTLIEEFEIGSGPESNCKLRFYNAFSPNGDGENEVWEIENIDLPEFQNNEVEIYNRWGQLIYEAEKYNNNSVVWTGDESGGSALPSGTYYFIVNVNGSIYKGYIELIR